MFDQVEYGENSLHFSALRYLPDTSRTLPTAMSNDFAFLPYQRMTCVAPNMTHDHDFFLEIGVFCWNRMTEGWGNPGSFFGGRMQEPLSLVLFLHSMHVPCQESKLVDAKHEWKSLVSTVPKKTGHLLICRYEKMHVFSELRWYSAMYIYIYLENWGSKS